MNNICTAVSPAKHNYIIGLPHRSAPGGDRNFLTVVAMYNDNNILYECACMLLYLNHVIRMPKTLFVDDHGIPQRDVWLKIITLCLI